ncbi:unnamed protein product [Dibothriocephalus latus]|uniref:Uncharacterized protein n=1 Tax=Dibothriocephalus latus TaxID=60516 RepID=A0A3P7R8Q4_DIBLA|nr:unnamed protein product [Dibothriocephalus latus]
MENSGAISPIDWYMAGAQETALNGLYGLPKVHKEGAPLRSIISLKATLTYGLAKWLFRGLEFLTSDAKFQAVPQLMGPSHMFKFNEAEILARCDNGVSHELLESWLPDP